MEDTLEKKQRMNLLRKYNGRYIRKETKNEFVDGSL